MTTCAYCGSADKKITGEHIIPSFVYKYQKTKHKISGWNEVAKKTIGGETKINDVCENCNNNILGELDAYAKKMLDQHGIFTDVFLQEELELKYDYDLLLRWLLKISFNATRLDGTQAALLANAVPYILGTEAKSPANIDFVVQLLKPAQHSAENLEAFKKFGTPVSECGKTNPFIARIGKALISGSHGGLVVRAVTMGALIFYIFIHEDSLDADSRQQILNTFIINLKSGSILQKNLSSMPIFAGQMNWIDAYGPALLRAKLYENNDV